MIDCEEAIRRTFTQALPEELASFLDEYSSNLMLFRILRRIFRETIEFDKNCDIECILKEIMEEIKKYFFNVNYEVKGNKVIVKNVNVEELKKDKKLLAITLGVFVGALEKAYPEAYEKIDIITPFKRFIHKNPLFIVTAEPKDNSIIMEVKRLDTK